MRYLMFVFMALGMSGCCLPGLYYTDTLHGAARCNNVKAIAKLLSEGHAVDESLSRYKTSPLFHAVSYGSYDAAVYLIEQGADVNYLNDHGQTPAFDLHYSWNGIKLARALKDGGADFSIVDQYGRTALRNNVAFEWKSGPRSYRAAEGLLKAGADPNAKTWDKEWPELMYAASDGDTRLVKLLLKYGADPCWRDLNDRTALDLAREEKAWRVVNLLEKYDCENGSK